MDSEVTIVVTRVHWHCSSCQVVNKHVVSIDQHLKSCHLDLISVATTSSPCPSPDLKLEMDDFSDGDFDFLNGSDEKRSQEELPEMTPSSVPDKSEETAQSGKNETTSSQSKSETRSLSPEDRSDTCEISQRKVQARRSSRGRSLSRILENKPRTTANTRSKSNVRKRKLSSSSVAIPETDPQQKGHSSHVQKTRQSLRVSTKDRKENQRHPDNASVRSPAEANSGKAEEQLKQEHRPRRKKQRLQLNSCNEDVQKEQMCNTHSDQSEVEDMGILSENSKSSYVKDDMDSKRSIPKKSTDDLKRPKKQKAKPPKRTKTGHSSSSEKPKILRKTQETVGRHVKKYKWVGTFPKRTQSVTEEKMKEIKLSYFGSAEFKIVNSTSKPTCLPSNQQAAVENIHIVTDSDAGKSNLQHPTSDETLASVAGTSLSAVHGRHTDLTEACGITETSKVNTPDLPGETCNSQSVVPFQGGSDNASSTRHDIQQSLNDSTMHREPESVAQTASIDVVSQTPSVVCENLCPPRQCTSASDAETPLTASTCHDLPDTDMSKVQNTEHSLTDIPQTDNICSQQDVGQVSKTMNEEPCNFENDVKSSETEERKTSCSVSKEKAVTSFEQLSKLHECTICLAKFSTDENLSDHLSKTSNFEPSECQDCQRPFHSAYDLNLHVFEDHERRLEPVCFDCGEKFQNMASFEKHLHYHKYNCEPKLLEMEYHLCAICQKDVPCRYGTLRIHYYTKHKTGICCECFVRSEINLFQDFMLLREHKTVHSNFCTVCFQDFTYAETLNDHYPCQSEFMNQEDGQGEVCVKCSQWCPNKALVNVHHKEHKLEVLRKFGRERVEERARCVYCDKVLCNKIWLQRHIARQHSDCRVYKFKCEHCGKGMDSKKNLQDHINVHHLGIKIYNCEYCDQRFASVSTRKRHILKEHATDRQYTCEVCGERFINTCNLARHMIRHTGTGRFMCDQCGKACINRSSFIKHLAVHEEKPVLTCQQCGIAQFKRRDHLTKHMKSKKCSRNLLKAVEDSGSL